MKQCISNLNSKGRYLLSGATDGSVYGWDLQQIQDGHVVPHCLKFPAHNDAVNGCRYVCRNNSNSTCSSCGYIGGYTICIPSGYTLDC